MTEDTLPNKPSDLIIVALADLEKVEANPNYVIQMDTWHMPSDDGRCVVCLAGSVIASTLNHDRFKTGHPGDFSGAIPDKLDALNDFRSGYLQIGLDSMGIYPDDYTGISETVHVASYADNPAEFKKDMLRIVKILQESGL